MTKEYRCLSLKKPAQRRRPFMFQSAFFADPPYKHPHGIVELC